MTRLIDADKLCEEFKERQRAALRWKEKAILDCDEERSIRADATLAFLSEVKLTIDKAPTVELFCSYLSDEEVKQPCVEAPCNHERPHGEWMKIEAPSYTIIRCTCCGYKDNAIYIPNYCPHCGADMREADNDKI